MATVISAQNVKKEFIVGTNTIPVIRGVNLDIFEGEFVIIFGPSGCGKSTLLNIISGWEEPTAGRVLIDGHNIYYHNEDERVKMCRQVLSMVHQAPNWVKSLAVVDNIMIPYILTGRNKKIALKRAMILLRVLNLDRFAHYRPMDLSGGQQQRISVLRALINNPRIILADEPTGNLDTSSSHVMMEFLTKINSELNRIIIMVTHNLDLLKYASKTVNIINGEIVSVKVPRKPVLRGGQAADIVDLVGQKYANWEFLNQ